MTLVRDKTNPIAWIDPDHPERGTFFGRDGMTPELAASEWLLAETESAPSAAPADYPLSARQLRLGLVRNGVSLGKVQATIDALPSPQRDEAQIYWEFSTEIHWGHPMTQSLMALAGISDEAAAAMWMLAKDYEK